MCQASPGRARSYILERKMCEGLVLYCTLRHQQGMHNSVKAGHSANAQYYAL